MKKGTTPPPTGGRPTPPPPPPPPPAPNKKWDRDSLVPIGKFIDNDSKLDRNILDDAKKITSVDRNTQYGEPEDCFKRIAGMWTVYLDHEVTPEQVCMMMGLLKIARERHTHKRDNLVDLAGYARCASKIMGDENEK